MIDIIEPKIFKNLPIIAGVTLTNYQKYQNGFSIGNAAFYGDETISDMRQELTKQLLAKYSEASMIFQHQIHSDIVKSVDSSYEYGESDALITNMGCKILNISIADCAAILIYEPIQKVIAGIHSGWRGTQQKILQKTIRIMQLKYHIDCEELLVYISPCASGERYEVGSEVAQYFPESVVQINDGKYLFDNANEIKLQLVQCGVKISNIELADKCTIEDNLFHSYRRDGLKSGRMSAFIGMK